MGEGYQVETALGSGGFAVVYLVRGMLWPRTFLLLGDLASARGQREEAARAYRVFLGIWEHGDPEVQPYVQQAREALARLGG